jgi:transcriptional regulator with XRE-family HTH domain
MQDRSGVADAVTRACTAGAGTVQALAEEVGVSYAALCSWSRARRQPPAHRLRKLADVLESRAEQLREIAVELRSRAGDGPPAATRIAAPSAGRPAALPLGIAAGPREQRGDGASRSPRPWAQALPEHTRISRERDRAAAAPALDGSR